MIITRTPLRVSFVGGGSDVPWFYNEEPGACVAASIDKYVYVTLSKKYEGTYRAAYSQIETVTHPKQLGHELIRQVLLGSSHTEVGEGIEIHSIADIPGGTGLGSSSAFTVGLLKALRPHEPLHDVIRRAIGVEIDTCHKSIGIQDQHTTARGGLHLLSFAREPGTTVYPLQCDLEMLAAHCLLLDTGLVRMEDAGVVLARQQQSREDVRYLAAMAAPFARALTSGSFSFAGAILNEAWTIKSKFIANDTIDAIYGKARLLGAWGGKLCGAGGGGFMLFMAPPFAHSRIVTALGMRQVPMQLGVPGSTVIYAD